MGSEMCIRDSIVCACSCTTKIYYRIYHLIFCVDKDHDTLNLALVQYCFTHGDHEIKVGNSRSGEVYLRIMPSVMTKLKAAATQKTPKRALKFVSNEQGGVMEASSAGSLPRCRQQVKDMRRKQNEDPLFSLMFMCNVRLRREKERMHL